MHALQEDVVDAKIIKRWMKMDLAFLCKELSKTLSTIDLTCDEMKLTCMWNIKSPPRTNSMTKNSLEGVWKHEWRPTRNGWFDAVSNTCFSVCTQSMSY